MGGTCSLTKKIMGFHCLSIYSLVFRGLAVLHHMFAIIYASLKDLPDGMDPRISDMFELSSRYFTNWSLVFQLVYLLIAFYIDLPYMSPKYIEWLSSIRDYMFSVLVLPCTWFTSAMYWTLHLLNEEYVRPKGCDKFIPSWLNHMVHTNVAIILVIEFLVNKNGLPNRKSAAVGLAFVLAIYDAMFIYTYFEKGRYLYEISNRLGFIGGLFFLAFSTVNIFVYMYVGFYLQKFKNNVFYKKLSDMKTK